VQIEWESFLTFFIVLVFLAIRFIGSHYLKKKKEEQANRPSPQKQAPPPQPQPVFEPVQRREAPPTLPTAKKIEVEVHEEEVSKPIVTRRIPRIQKVVNRVGSKRNLILLSEILRRPY